MLMPTISVEEAIKRGYDSPNIQTILFKKNKWDRASSTKWLKEHDYTAKYYRTTKNDIRRMQHNPVEGATYYSKRLPNGIVLVFQNWHNEGTGVMDFIKSAVDRLSFKKREAGILPPKSRELLAQIQNEPIVSLTVVRTPIESYINRTLQLVSGGAWQNAIKQAGYDKLFHLSLFINNQYVLHKIETTTLARENPIKAESQTMPVNGPFPTIGELVEKTKTAMGPQRFTNYDPATENCQDFLIAVLSANNLLTPQLQQFIKQDAVAIFEKTPQWTAKFAKFVTDLGARFNRLTQGEAIEGDKSALRKYIPAQKRKAKQYGMSHIKNIIISPLKNKKYRVILKDGTHVDYGNPAYEDMLQHGDPARRDRFIKRWMNNPNRDNIHSPVYYILRLNW